MAVGRDYKGRFISLSWNGTDIAMSSRLKNLAKRFPDEVVRALYVETEIEVAEVKRRTPVSPHGGQLRASVHQEGPTRQGNMIFTLIVAGGPSAPYAIAVHEHLSEHSPPSWVKAETDGHGIHWNASGTGPKFIESVIMESRPYMGIRVARRIDLNRAMQA